MKTLNKLTIEEITNTMLVICNNHKNYWNDDYEDVVIKDFYRHYKELTFNGMNGMEVYLFKSIVKQVLSVVKNSNY